MVERLFLAVPRGYLQFVIVVFPDHTYLLFLILCRSMLILLSGDVEVNPGPDSAEDTSFTSDDQSLTSFETLSNHLSFFHLNIQSLVPKIDIV